MNKESWSRYIKAAVFAACFFLVVAVSGSAGTVQAAAKSKVRLSNTKLTMQPATRKSLKLVGAPSSKVKWSSSKSRVAAVDKSGRVTAKTKGAAKIRASYKGKKYTCKVSVVYGKHTASDGMRYQDKSGNFGYTGRWFTKNVNGKNCRYTCSEGSAIYFKVTGSAYVNVGFVSQIAVATPYFAYSVDGKAMRRQLISNGKISVGSSGTHYVRLVVDAMSEYENRWAGEAGVGITGVSAVSSGGVVTAIMPTNATIAFYGDSITQGVRALNMSLSPDGTSVTHSYAWYCAAQLDLVPYLSGFGGTGIIQPGSFNNCINAIESYSAYRKAGDFNADVIVVEHGTNDVYTYGEVFINEYRRVLELLHRKHPKAYIMAMLPFTRIHADEIKSAASSYKWCTVVDPSSWGVSYTDGLHPNKAGARRAGERLARKVASTRKVTLK